MNEGFLGAHTKIELRKNKEALFKSLSPEQKIREIERESIKILTTLSEAGGIEYTNTDTLYKKISAPTVIVRRESPDRLMDTIANDEPLVIDFPEGERYSNAVEWLPGVNDTAIGNAFLEGYGQTNGVVTVFGYVPKPDADIQTLPDAEKVFAGIGRAAVRSVRGEIRKEDIAFVTVRIPASAYPYENMTNFEQETFDTFTEEKEAGKKVQPMFIYRGYKFDKTAK